MLASESLTTTQSYTVLFLAMFARTFRLHTLNYVLYVVCATCVRTP